MDNPLSKWKSYIADVEHYLETLLEKPLLQDVSLVLSTNQTTAKEWLYKK